MKPNKLLRFIALTAVGMLALYVTGPSRLVHLTRIDPALDAFGVTATPTATNTPTATATLVIAAVPTPTVAAAVGGCESLSTTGLVAGVSWCQDQSENPIVLKVWDGAAYVRPVALSHGLTPPSSAANNSLWYNTNDIPPVLEKCNGTGCGSSACTQSCGTWNPLMVPNFGPLPSPVP